MNIRDLEAFIAVIETGSIVAASARLHLTQPGVTRRVQSLEDALGTPLLDRQSKPLKPTLAGRGAYEQGRRVLRTVEDLRAGVSPQGAIRGELRLGVMPYLSDAALSSPLDRLRNEFPELTIRLTSGWSPRLLEQLMRNELDVAALCLTADMQPPEDLVGHDLGMHDVVLIAARTLGVPKRATLVELSRFPWVMNESGCGFRNYIRRSLEAARLPFQVAVEALSADMRLSLVERGLGIGIVTPAALASSPHRHEIQIIETPDFQPKVRSWLLYRAPLGRLRLPIKVFREALAEQLPKPKRRRR
jgi:DNA-binding transcriptional LysR family regulator